MYLWWVLDSIFALVIFITSSRFQVNSVFAFFGLFRRFLGGCGWSVCWFLRFTDILSTLFFARENSTTIFSTFVEAFFVAERWTLDRGWVVAFGGLRVEKEVVGTFLIFISVAVCALIVRVTFILVRIHSVLTPAGAEAAHLN